MNSLKIKLAGILFKVWFDKDRYEVHDVKRFDPRNGWTTLPGTMEDQVKEYLPAEVLMTAARLGGNDCAMQIDTNTGPL